MDWMKKLITNKVALISIIAAALVLISVVMGIVLLSPADDGGDAFITTKPTKVIFDFLDDLEEYGYTVEQINTMGDILANVGITDISDLEIGEISEGVRLVKGVARKSGISSSNDEVEVQLSISDGEVSIVTLYCPNSSEDEPILDGMTSQNISLYDKDFGGYVNKVDWEQGEIIEHPDHTHAYVHSVIESTCTEQGYTTYTCSCGYSYTDNYVNATGHDFSAWEETKIPTCTEKGEEKRTCSCDYSETRETAAKGHSYTFEVIEPTCTTQGYTTYTCSCGYSYTDNYVNATGHDFSAWEETKIPTCTEKGEEKRTCYCGYSEAREIAAKGHSYTFEVTEPTCTTQGYTTYTCSCGYSYIDNYVNATGHDFSAWEETKIPTCTEKGEEKRTCYCGYSEAREIAAKGHSYTFEVTEPTCTTQGYTTYTCSCGYSYTDNYVNATGHDFSAWEETKIPTCTEKGEEKRTCSCGYSETREIAAKGHSYEFEITEPTCTTQGYTTYTCSCGYSYMDDYVNANGHNYWNWSIIKYPTLTEEGIEERGCYNCGEMESRSIPKRNPSEGLEMTLNADGKSYSVTGIGTCTDMDIYIPFEYNGLPVTIIGEQAFWECSFDNVFIPESIVSIENSAFWGSSISSIIIPKSVTSIGAGAFSHTDLTSVVIPEGVTSIGGGAFGFCKYLSEISVPDSLISFGSNMFRTMTSNANIKYNKYKGGLYIGNENNPYVVLMSIEDISITSFEFHPDTKIIASYAFSHLVGGYNDYESCELLSNIDLPNGLRGIGAYAFLGCTSLKSITIPNSVTNIDYGAFKYCRSLENITIPNSVSFIGTSETFKGCLSLKNVSMPNNITIIRSGMFENCVSLESVSGLGNVVEIERWAFYNCCYLENIDIESQLIYVGDEAFYNCQKLKNISISNNVTFVGEKAFVNCKSLEYNVYDNALYLGNRYNPYVAIIQPQHKFITTCEIHPNTKIIPNYTFSGCNALQSVNIPEGITHIGYHTFSGCGMYEITIPESVISIDMYAFYNCVYLKKVINKSNIELEFGSEDNGYLAYYAEIIEDANGICHYRTWNSGEDSEYTIVTTEDGFVWELRGDTYTLVGYTGEEPTVTLPVDMNGKYYDILELEGAINVIIPENFQGYFMNVSLKNTKSLKSLTLYNKNFYYIGFPAEAFSNCVSLERVEVSEDNHFISVDGNIYNKYDKTLIFYAQGKTNTSFEIPEGTTKIGNCAFAGCNQLTSITIPSSVTNIDAQVFSGCDALTSVYYCGDIEEWLEIDFDASTSNPMCYADYLYFAGELITNVSIPDSITSINNYAFYGCDLIEKITIPDSVTSIGDYAFADCALIKSIVIPNTVTSIGDGVFSGCVSLETVTISDVVTNIPYKAFYGCVSVESISITGGVNYIGDYAFYGCISLESIYLPYGVISIGWSAFGECVSLETVNIPDSVSDMGGYLFYNCYSLEKVVLGNCITGFDNWTFENCISLEEVVLGNSVSSIAGFKNCISLKKITIPKNVAHIYLGAFSGCQSLEEIVYKGTMAEWRAIDKSSFWMADDVKYTVYCTDGTLIENTYNQ